MKLQSKQYHLKDYISLPLHVSAPLTIGALSLKLFAAMLPALQVLVVAAFLDGILAELKGEGNTAQISLWFLGLLGMIVLKNLTETAWRLVRHRLSLRMEQELTLAVVQKQASLKFCYIEDSKTWELTQRVVEGAAEKWMEGLEQMVGLLTYVVEAAGLFLVIAHRQWQAAVVTMILLIPFFVISVKNGAEEYEAYEDASKHFRRAKYLRRLLAGREAAEERYLFGYGSYVNELWNTEYKNAVHVEKEANKLIFTRVTTGNVLAVFFGCVIMAVLLVSVADGKMTAGIYISLIKGIWDFIDSISWNFAQLLMDFEKSRLYLKDFSAFSELKEEEGVTKPVDVSVHTEMIREVEFRDVSFVYSKTEKPVLNHFSAVLKGGKRYALVGVNGAGKTTLIKLLTGLYPEYEGEILINGRELRQMKSEELRGYFAVVYQDFCRYALTVEENIRLSEYGAAKKQRNKKREQEILEKMSLIEFADTLPQGMNTLLGKLDEQSIDLSGGQWQRIAIMRALINDAPIHILDEPTAALDPVSEAALYDLFYEVMQEHFVLLVTHRLGAARLADEILVLENGVLAECGTHEALLAQKGIYAGMYETQRGWYHE